MPRPKKEGSGPPKTRSRFGCWPCKQRKIKCGEEKPTCNNCIRQGEQCDYSIRLNWDARSRSKSDDYMKGIGIKSMPNTPSTIVFPSPEIFSGKSTPAVTPTDERPKRPAHSRSRSNVSSPTQDAKTLAQSTLSFDPRPQLLSPGWSTLPPTSAFSTTNHDVSNERAKRLRISGPDMNAYSMNDQRSPVAILNSPPLGYPGNSPVNGEVPLFDTRYDPYENGLSRSSTITIEREKQSSIEFKAIPCRFYGYDRGLIDFDDKNDDSNVLIVSPNMDSGGEATYDSVTIDFDNYYDKPVKVAIPISLHPLPDTLKQNQMNLLYFHHYLNHTARILTPHDCPANPFRIVLPKMAVADPDLLRLLLAYSACHRSSLVRQGIPSTRIAAWLDGVFGSIRAKISDGQRSAQEQNALVASTIMLSSLDIISYASVALGATYSWPMFLNSARAAMLSRPTSSVSHFDDHSFFLCRWFGYLDIIGSLSAKSPVKAPVDLDKYWVEPDEPPGVIDCLLGCTISGMKLLGQVAQLVKECEPYRLDTTPGLPSRVRPVWLAPLSLRARAEGLVNDLEKSVAQRVYTCPHDRLSPSSVAAKKQDLEELETTNTLYHWAGVIQVRRRVLGQTADSKEIRHAVMEISNGLEKIRAGSPAEACLLFPIFTAGCEVLDMDLREKFRQRITDIEGFGLKQVSKAKDLIERVWHTGDNWESLVTDEFLG